jgi:uncharacterized membrane protein YheB (UPF0754 family)
MDILIDQLPVSHANKDLLWTFKDRPDLFAKFTQYAKEEHNIVKEDVSQEVAKDITKDVSQDVAKDVSHDVAKDITKDVSQKVAKHITKDITKDVSQDITKDITKDIIKDVSQHITKDVSQKVAKDITKDVSQDITKDLGKKTPKTKKTSPMHIIISLSDNNIINQDYINDQLKAFISKPEFQKVFGIKKTSEIMKGLTENKWNKSLVLFLSFLFEKPFVYLAKDVTYYPDKEYNDIDKIVI